MSTLRRSCACCAKAGCDLKRNVVGLKAPQELKSMVLVPVGGRPVGTIAEEGYGVSWGRPVGTTAEEEYGVSLGRPVGTTAEEGYGVSPGRPVGTTKKEGYGVLQSGH